jgi:polysaccharide deacetylase family protein (PEP-CTERM system associated)
MLHHGFSVDVEEWFDGITQGDTIGWERRLQGQLEVLLDLLEEYQTNATFFWLGSRALEYPKLVRRVEAHGHEIACHGLHHRPLSSMSPDEFYDELQTATNILQEISGKKIMGFRAPDLSITKRTLWAFEILCELGYQYDSSVMPITRWLTGIPGYSREIQRITTPSGKLTEVPLPVRSFASLAIPRTGGVYFRFYPYWLTCSNIASAQAREKSVVFQIHPWELDAELPKIKTSLVKRFTQYHSLERTTEKLHQLLRDFSFTTIAAMLSEHHFAAAERFNSIQYISFVPLHGGLQ